MLLQQEFQRQNLGARPPQPSDMEVPPGIFASCVHGTQSVFLTDLCEASQFYCIHYLQKYGPLKKKQMPI